MTPVGDIETGTGDSGRNSLENIGISRRAIDCFRAQAQSVLSRNDDLAETRRERRKVDLRKNEETSPGQGDGVAPEVPWDQPEPHPSRGSSDPGSRNPSARRRRPREVRTASAEPATRGFAASGPGSADQRAEKPRSPTASSSTTSTCSSAAFPPVDQLN